jgi:ABC-type uncharacterized transport system permease subunit
MTGDVLQLRELVKQLLRPLAWLIRQLRAEAHASPGLAVLLLTVLLFCAATAIAGSRLAALALIPLALAWILFNGPFEGPTLIAFSWAHGVTASDLISFACLIVAAWRLVPVLFRSPAR